MDRIFDPDIDPAPLVGKRVAIIGYGNQGRAQALNLQDSGINVVVGLRSGSATAAEVKAAGLATASHEDAAASAGLVMLLIPDETMAGVYGQIEPHLRPGMALGFSHGLAIHFDFIKPRSDLDVFLLAPKGPGTALRSLYVAGDGMTSLWAVAQDGSGNARATALAYGQAIGSGRAGLIARAFPKNAKPICSTRVPWCGVRCPKC